MSSLFEAAAKELLQRAAPLADRVRPRGLDEYFGQEDLVGPGSPLRRAIEADDVTSMLLWGPPGSGKTTLARIIAETTRATFVSFSAVTSGIKEAREIIQRARDRLVTRNQKTILFADEIHRFNKAQQDAFLPHVENGTVTLIGATTENPSFEINSALLSRCRVLVLKALSEAALCQILRTALADPERGLGGEPVEAEAEALALLAASASGDARTALSNLEWVVACLPGDESPRRLSAERVSEALPHKTLLYDKSGEEHFNLISALHKSIRGSDPQAALYWLARMLAAGEDPMYLARRLVRVAMEDVGLADPQALPLAVAAKDAYHLLGKPEGELALAELSVYLACAPKSNSVYKAFDAALEAARSEGPLPVPLHLRNAPTGLMKDLGYGREYQYDHDSEHAHAGQECLPEQLKGRTFYQPGGFGFEREVRKRLEWWAGLRAGG